MQCTVYPVNGYLLAGGSVIAWNAFGMPPLRLVLKYGYPSPMAPTGRTVTIEGVEFVEISAGYIPGWDRNSLPVAIAPAS